MSVSALNQSSHCLAFELFDLVIKHEGSYHTGGKVGDGHTEPNAVHSPEERENQQERDKYHHLPA